jgi:hypothetical protein
MQNRVWLRLLLAGFAWAAFLATPGLPLPGADRLGFAGTAAAQDSIDIDTFYDELAPYGQWVWHPRYGYVWLPEDVSPRWRPYTVGRWTYTDEYGWYWDSYEPFAWAVYHYGRWGYDEDYGWFWVPGDTWAPAWVQWRYSDDYVGWAPIGPGRRGYAYGVPVNYEPPIAESWVFVQPRYMTSRAISHYALPIGGLSVAFFGATNVYRPIYRGGVVYNYGMPRDRVVKIIRRPIYVQKVYRVDNWKGGRFDRDDRYKGIKIYSPRFNKDGRNRGPKKFVDNPRDFKPRAKLNDTFRGDVPKGWGKSAKGLTPIAKEDPEGFKKKPGRFDGHDHDFGDRGKDRDKGRDRDNDKDQATGTVPPINKVIRDQSGEQTKATQPPIQKVIRDQDASRDGDRDRDGRDRDKRKDKGQASKDFDRDGGKKDKGPPAPKLPPPLLNGDTDDQSKDKVGATKGRDDRDRDRDRNKGKPKNFGAPGGPGGPDQFQQSNQGDFGDQGKPKKNFGAPGGPNQFKQGNRDEDRGGGQRKQKTFDGPGAQGGAPNQFQQGGGGQGVQGGQRAQGDQGGGGGGGKKDKCQKNPDHPSCRN